jgi:hypothetical protein
VTRDRPRIELERVSPEPSPEERAVLEAALHEIVERERKISGSSLWLRAALSQGRRLGMLDYRDRFSKDDAWRLSARFPSGGREYPGLNGRGDAK